MKGTSLLIFLFVACAAPKVDPILGPLADSQPAFRQCYLESDLYQGRNDKPQGSVVIDFRILKSGKVEDERIVRNTFRKDPNFEACLLDQARRVKFGNFETETSVSHPLNFLPVKL